MRIVRTHPRRQKRKTNDFMQSLVVVTPWNNMYLRVQGLSGLQKNKMAGYRKSKTYDANNISDTSGTLHSPPHPPKATLAWRKWRHNIKKNQNDYLSVIQKRIVTLQ